MDLAILDKRIFERFIRPTVNKKPQYVGVEFELPLVNLKSAPVDFAVVHALVDAFLEHFGFVPVWPGTRELFVRRGLPGFVDREKLRHLLEQVVALAEQGLRKRGLGEEHMLQPLKERARRLTSPALELVEGLNRGHSIEDYIEAYGRLEG